MKILVNGLLLINEFSGVQYSIENLLLAIGRNGAAELDMEVLLPGRYKGCLTEGKHVMVKELKSYIANRARRISYENFSLPKYFSKNRFDLYHSPAYLLPRFANVPSVVTIHDLLALDFPQYCQRESAVYFSLCQPASIYRARKIIAVSATVKDDIIRRFEIDPERITVVYHGVEEIFKPVTAASVLEKVTARYRLPEKFILFVGNLEPKKNLERLIRAFSDVKKNAGIGHKLVITGKKGWKYRDIYKSILTAGMEKEVVFTGYVDRMELPALYTLADLFVFPSLYEGFGLPVLEAMSCGTPVLISDGGALPEIAGDVYPRVDPLDEKDIALKLHLLLTNAGLRRKNIQYGFERVKEFTWERSARKTIDVYREALNKA